MTDSHSVDVDEEVGVLRAAAALGLDAAWLGVRLAGYPLGTRPARPRAAATRELGEASTPVVLVHGVLDNRSAFTVLAASLRRRGFRHVSTFGYPLLTRDVQTAARLLAEHVEAVCDEVGVDRVHIVGHSLGGLIARWYVQQQGGEARVDALVTIGSPHAGTHAARLLPLPIVRQLQPGSAMLRTLAAPAPGCRTRIVSVWSDHDEVVLPRSSARLDHPDLNVTDVRLRGVGHVALPAHPRVLATVAAAMRVHPGPVTPPIARPVAATGAPVAAARPVAL